MAYKDMEAKREYEKKYNQNPKRIAWRREYEKKRAKTPKRKEWKLKYEPEYRSDPINKERRWERDIQKKFGLTAKEYYEICEAQNNQCAICYVDKPGGRSHGKWLLDHCHSTGKVRGLLCHRCNFNIGNFNDDADILENAAKYLRKQFFDYDKYAGNSQWL